MISFGRRPAPPNPLGGQPDVFPDQTAENEDWGRRFAEEHRQLVSRWFYECSYEIHTGLADMYVADERFTAYFETIRPGMAVYLGEAIHANAITRA